MDSQVARHALGSTVYFIWCTPNKALFEGEIVQLHAMVLKVTIHVLSIIFGTDYVAIILIVRIVLFFFSIEQLKFFIFLYN